MTQAEAMVYAAAFAEHGAKYAATRVIRLRDSFHEPDELEISEMLAEFRAFGEEGAL